ncbi:MAG: ABC transporter permease [Muribaculaceae bacterium]|nr:ABC transporter permease [Muribaculaceae bacterium]
MKSKIGIVIAREFKERVRKKSFIISTILMPVFMIAMMAVPSLMLMFSKGEKKEIAVVDNSGFIADKLVSSDEISYFVFNHDVDSARKMGDIYGILHIGDSILTNSSDIRLYANDAPSINVDEDISHQVSKIIENEKLKAYNIHDLDQILDEVKTEVSLRTFDNSDEGSSTSSLLSYIVGLIFSLLLYMFILLYGNMVMNSIIEEKTNRVLELMVSSIKPAQLMLGKIIGVGLVATVQILIWGVLIALASGLLIPALMPANVAADVAAINADPTAAISSNVDMVQALALFGNVGQIIHIFVIALLYLVGGFLFYAAIFVAIGAAVDNVQDASQFTGIAMFPIMAGLIISMSIANSPNSGLAFWTSMIPFTSPMVMMSRIAYNVPSWEVAVSLVVLFMSILAMIWMAAKVYRVDIFMYGKKPSLKEIVRWMKYK